MSRPQLRPLAALRWRMVRSPQARWGFAALGAALVLACVAAAAVGAAAPDQRAFDVLLLAPTMYLTAALVAVLAPLVAGGGNELFPEEQLVAFPVTSRTVFTTSLALSPLNLAWSAQLVVLIGVTAYSVNNSPLLVVALVTSLAYVACVTVVGQAVAWTVVGVRQRRAGRLATWGLAGALLAGAGAVIATGNLAAVLDGLPTTYVVIGAVNGAAGAWGSWVTTMAVLAAVTTFGLVAGRAACDWALRRPGDAVQRSGATPVRRRNAARDARRQLLATDRASVWRSAALRRGLLVLAVMPGLVAATAGLSWSSLVLLPGLVAAGSGLLFGVNAFCLDGSGSPWLASLPGHGRMAFWSKARVVGEVCLVAVALALAAGSLRSGGPPSAAEGAAVLACSVVVIIGVVATSMTLSVTRPHRADLRGPRDTPAPPGAMAAYSARLAVSTTVVSLLFAGLAELATWQWSVLWALPLALLSVRRLVRAAAIWSRPDVRAKIVTVVSAG